MNTKVKKESVVPFRRIEHWLIVINSLWIGGMGLKGDHPNQREMIDRARSKTWTH